MTQYYLTGACRRYVVETERGGGRKGERERENTHTHTHEILKTNMRFKVLMVVHIKTDLLRCDAILFGRLI
jgi:hypothetical protein